MSLFLKHLEQVVGGSLRGVAFADEYLSLLRWQIAEGHALDSRTTMPGHITTSAIVLSPNHQQVLLIDHVAIGRWLQPGGHFEDARYFHQSAAREAIEETRVNGLRIHPWHGDGDIPFAIDSQDVEGKSSRCEPSHVHHDLQYLFVADPSAGLQPQLDEVHAASWKSITTLREIAPKSFRRLSSFSPSVTSMMQAK